MAKLKGPLVTVFVVIYNAQEYVPKAVGSVLEQSYNNLEILLLDDGSTEAGVEMFCGLVAEDRRVSWIRFETTNDDRRRKVTYASNINDAAQFAKGDYFTFLAGDDYYHLDRCERMVDKLLDGHDVVYGSQERPNANGRFVPALATDVLTDAFNRVDMSSVMMTRAAFEAVEGFDTDPANWGDADAHFWRRLTGAGYVFVPIDNPERYSDAKVYRDNSVQERWNKGLEPWV